ncbi:MAG: 2-polyprenylphenol 6-hydroxylase [Alphaproteobacteria bacterium]|nr:2-polyprenylphenol 6-hydroxylase [Alphaproteobacteria bacterium]
MLFHLPGHLVRLAKIVRTLAAYDALEAFGLAETLPFAGRVARHLRRPGLPARPGERLALALADLGPGFVKLGQVLSTRADIVGEAVAADLTGLQDSLPPFDFAHARATIENEFGKPIAELYATIDETAVAAASIAQVHFATTVDGREVAVKVLRPGVEKAFARDVDLLAWIAALVERFVPKARRLKPGAVVEKLAQTVRFEMDLRLEAAAAEELGANFPDDPEFRVPKPDWTRTGKRVLTTARISGIPIDERERLIAAGHDPQEIVAKAARAFFRQVFRDGFFHADMHPGNIFVAEDGALVAVDFGIMGRIDKPTRIVLADMLAGFLNQDYRKVAEVHFRAGFVPATQDMGAFAQAARAIAEPILGLPLEQISLARLLAQLFEVTEQFQMETQPQLLLLQKSMLVCEGVGRKLDPDINMWTLARPLIESWMMENRGPMARIATTGQELLERIEELPALVANLDHAAALIAGGGVRLHPDTLKAFGTDRAPARWPWVLAGAAGAAFLYLLFH